MDSPEATPQQRLEGGRRVRAPHREPPIRHEAAGERVEARFPVHRLVVHCDRPLRTVVDVEADRVVPVGPGAQPNPQVGGDYLHPRVVHGVRRPSGEVGAVPAHHRRLDLYDRHELDARAPDRLGEREADPEPADQQPRARRGGTQRRPDQLPLRPAVSGVHQEDAVADDLAVLARASQDQLAARGAQALDRDGRHVPSVGASCDACLHSPGTRDGASPEEGRCTVTEASLYGGTATRRVRIHHLREAKERGERWPMLTAYEQYAAGIFDAAGVPVLLVGDSAANNVYGYESTLRITVDELIPLTRAVVAATSRALVVADLPFGSYQAGPEQALATAVRFMKETGAHAVKLEGGRRVAPQVETLVSAGIPVMAHLGFTPQSEHALGGYRVQGRGDAADELLEDAVALQAAGAFAVVLEMVPAVVAKRITGELLIPTIGIGAGPDCDAQVLVWQDMAGLRGGRTPRFVKRYADLRGVLEGAVATFAEEVRTGPYPGPEHSYG